jgi:hypothetical protein
VPKGLGETTPATITNVDPVSGDTTTLKLECGMITKLQKTDKEKFEYYHQLNRRTECVILSFDYVAPVAPKEEEEGAE